MFDDIFDDMRRLQREINRSFGDFLDSDIMALPDKSKSGLNLRNPLADLEETDKEVIARFDIPGFDKKDIQLNITENAIEVKAEKKAESKIDKKGFSKIERSYGGFYRKMSLNCPVNPDRSKARYKDGVLEVIMPKQEDKKRSKINIE